jgi:integrase
VTKVIAEARVRNAALGLYLWLVVMTGVRRGELCGLQIRDIDLERGLVHVAPSITSFAAVSASARTSRPARTAGSPSTRPPAR